MRRSLPILLLLLLAASALAEQVKVDPPLKLFTYKKDKSVVDGDLTGYDEKSFDVADAKKKSLTVQWDELEAKNVYQIHERLLTQAGGNEWLALAQQLVPLPDGKPWAERALVKAMRLDPTI